jgi:hypothetical protein
MPSLSLTKRVLLGLITRLFLFLLDVDDRDEEEVVGEVVGFLEIGIRLTACVPHCELPNGDVFFIQMLPPPVLSLRRNLKPLMSTGGKLQTKGPVSDISNALLHCCLRSYNAFVAHKRTALMGK